MRIIIFLVLSGFLLSQSDTTQKPIDETPKTIITAVEIPETVKPAVDIIVNNSEEARKASSELDKEIKKQAQLMKQIRLKISNLKKSEKELNKIEKVNETNFEKKDSITIDAIKPNNTDIQVNGQLIKWEFRQKTVFGIVFHSGYYPYIKDEKGKKIYLKIK